MTESLPLIGRRGCCLPSISWSGLSCGKQHLARFEIQQELCVNCTLLTLAVSTCARQQLGLCRDRHSLLAGLPVPRVLSLEGLPAHSFIPFQVPIEVDVPELQLLVIDSLPILDLVLLSRDRSVDFPALLIQQRGAEGAML